MADQKPEREPRALSTEYHKARKQLMLWAGILFIWELVGIDLEKARDTGGSAGAIITAIKSPQAVPWALLILVGYFLFRFTVEWYQSNVSRRGMAVAKIDFYSSWFISLLAIALYVGQSVRRVQFANLTGSSRTFAFFWIGLMSGASLVVLKFFASPLERVLLRIASLVVGLHAQSRGRRSANRFK